MTVDLSTLNYLQQTKERLVGVEADIHTLIGKLPSAKTYGLFGRAAYPYWRNITGDTQISRRDDGSELRTHTIYLAWMLGPLRGEEGTLERYADEWIVVVFDAFQSRPELRSAMYPAGQPKWLNESIQITKATGVIFNRSADAASQDVQTTASITFTLTAPFRVTVQRSY